MATAPWPLPPDRPAVLFIGNSLTSQNDLARRCAIVAADSGTSIDTQGVAISGASLLDHWDDGRARRAVASRRWAAVVLQQGPSTLPASREELTRLSALFGEEIRRAGGRPALLMVWPLPGQQAAAVSASYRAAAEATDSLLIPAGDAWVRAKAADPSLVLTEADGFHPSPLGTELAALSVVCTLSRVRGHERSSSCRKPGATSWPRRPAAPSVGAPSDCAIEIGAGAHQGAHPEK